MATKPELYFDVRTVERNIASGKLTQKEHQAFLRNLPDVEDKSMPVLWNDDGEAQEASEGDE